RPAASCGSRGRGSDRTPRGRCRPGGGMSCPFADGPLSSTFCPSCRFLFERQPLGGHGEIALRVRDSFLLEPFAEACPACGLDEMPHGTVNEPAAVALAGHAVEHRDGLLRQDDVNALAHEFLFDWFIDT